MGVPDPATSRALIIGVGAYESLPGLPSVANNVARLSELLTHADVWGLPEEHCVVLSDPRSPVDVIDAVHAAAAEARDAFVVYFAGHGLLSPEADLYLALPDSHAERLHHAVEYNRLRDVLVNVCTARSRVVVLDCCYSARALEGHLGTPVDFADHTRVDGTYLMTACAETKTALAPPGEDYTAFTGELIKTLSEGVPAGSDPLDMDAVFWHVRKELIAKNRPVPQQRARNAGHGITLVRNRWSGARSPEALAYGQALREACRSADDRGLPPQLLADSAGLSASALHRYFQGGRLAPRDFLERLGALSVEHHLALPPEDLDRLDLLRRRAQHADPDAEIRLEYWQEETERLKADLDAAAHERAAQHDRASGQLTDLEGELAALGRELDAAVARAEEAERERDALLLHREEAERECDASHAAGDRQRRQLAYARDYTRGLENDLTAQKDRVRLLQREVTVLHGQVRTLLGERAATDASDSGPDMLVGVAQAVADATAGEGADPPPGSGPPSGPRHAPGTAESTDGGTPAAPGRTLRGLCIALAVLAVLYTLVAGILSVVSIPLEYDDGREPAAATAGARNYVWDVRHSVVSTFRPGSARSADGLRGSLTFSVPAACTDRTLHWQVTVDGHAAGRGTLRGKRNYDVPAQYAVDHTPSKVTVFADWDGGSGSCSTFGLVWHTPELSGRFDLLFPF
ncbi:caspase family protein [Streptomyces sp. NPDC101150]|uniref:caspase, EACC1-associated type n=1 Tax=Streptomyces sp. NPDC101150 TaxID=3366114 RepID=UPI00380EFB99